MVMKEINIITDVRAVTAAGTPERINEETNKYRAKVIYITIRAHGTNAGLLYFAESYARASSTEGRYLGPGETWTLSVAEVCGVIDLQNIWVDAANSGDGFSYDAIEVF